MTHDHGESDIDRWLNEGGVQLPISVAVLDPGILEEAERRVIACLGAAILVSGMKCQPTFGGRYCRAHLAPPHMTRTH